jgi:hypothetical protein
MPAQEFQIETTVVVGMEDRLAVVSALGDVVGDKNASVPFWTGNPLFWWVAEVRYHPPVIKEIFQ